MKFANIISPLGAGFGAATALAMPGGYNQGPGTELKSPLKSLQYMRTHAMRKPTVDAPAPHYQSISKMRGKATGRSAVEALRQAGAHVPGNGYQNVTALTEESTQYAIQVTWDDKPISLLFDTGSSDTWAVHSNFSCISRFSTEQDENACAWGPDVIDGFRYGETPDVHIAVAYGSGEVVTGPMGRSDISVAGITVKEQQCGLVNETYWYGNNITNGLLGLAYPSLTSAYMGKVGDEREGYRQAYEPFFSRMVSQGLVDPVFSVAIEKGSNEGVIAWGGLPPKHLWSGDKVAHADIIVANLIGTEDSASYTHSFYTIMVDKLQWNQAEDDTRHIYIVDTGTSMMYLPPPLAESIAHAFTPRGTYLYQYGGYFVDCDAIPPRLSVVIGGVDFDINPDDLIYRDSVDPMSGLCMMAISTGGFGPYILGDVFLQNVMAVFDIGAAQMRFYSRN